MSSPLFFLVLLGLLCQSLCATWYPEDEWAIGKLFRDWQKEHKKGYVSSLQEFQRLAVFRDNLRLINLLNKRHWGETEFAINQFADLSPAEFKERVLMPSRSPPVFPADRYHKSIGQGQIPDTFDWSTQGKVTSVKDQGTVGTCWAFSTVGNIEGQWAMAGQQLTNLSVEQIVDCDGGKDIVQEKADCGVFGGWPYLAFQYVEKAGGLEKWEDYIYCSGIGGGPGTCFPCEPKGYNKTLCGPPIPYCLKNESCDAVINPAKFVPGLKVIGWKAIDKDESKIAEALVELGPLSVALDAQLLQFYHSGVFNPPLCSTTALDHAVLLVGYGNYKGVFKTEPYWKIKNSWGHKWGLGGYFLMKRGEGTCGVNTQVTTAILAKP